MLKKKLRTVGAILASAGKTELARKVTGGDEEYQKYFEKKMKKFGVNSPSELNPAQWEEIDKGWNAKKESDGDKAV